MLFKEEVLTQDGMRTGGGGGGEGVMAPNMCICLFKVIA